MKNLEQQGVRKKWTTDRKRIRNNAADWISCYDEKNKQLLLDYAKTGIAKANYPGANMNIPDVDPPLENWEQFLDNLLSMYASMRGFEMEMASLDAGRFETELAAQVFAAMYTHEMVKLNYVYLTPQRADGRRYQIGWLHHVPFTALGMVIGCRQEAETLARLYLALCRRGDARYLGSRSTGFFILRLMADFLDEAQLPVQERSLGYPTYAQLVDNWRNPDPQSIAPLCLAVCDLHTHMTYKQPDGEPGEFSFNWTYSPIEILLVFKLRQLIGLENPVLDHPILAGPFASLPPEVPFAADELITAVRARMKSDHFDEARIAARILKDEYPLPLASAAA